MSSMIKADGIGYARYIAPKKKSTAFYMESYVYEIANY